MLSTQIPEEFKDIRPYADDELPQVFTELMADEQFLQVAAKLVPDLKQKLAVALPALTGGAGSSASASASLAVQKTFFYPLVQRIIKECTEGIELTLPNGFDRQQPHTFITNHRDIVLDSAFLSVLLVDNGFPTTVEIAIGDNLLIFPWIKKLVRINKSFIVQRSLSMREMLRASQTMSRYMHFAISEKQENIWIAQREGRAKDSDDRTQDALLKMMAMGGEGTVIERLRQLHLAPMALSYEYDPCDYLKAKEFQQKRDNPDFKKSREDDLINMQTGIFGQKGHIHFQAAPCIDNWLDYLDPETPKTELFPMVAQHIDEEIHRSYRLYPGNYVAADALRGESTFSSYYTREQLLAFDDYLSSRIALIDLPEPDEPFLRERLLTMYANPVFNKEKAMKSWSEKV
ncbi:MAG: 1-acyl-sn-glycerol-3-phosphate acyltransferase [Bacteroidaceae bacterium]|nr:1-acyl-sn-glycerol-3-phosphate acyltransferase [Bacteroidaceae bacterium]